MNGGNNFHFIEESANLNDAVNDIYADTFSYSCQNRLSCSRLYIPESLLNSFMIKMKDLIKYNSENNIIKKVLD